MTDRKSVTGFYQTKLISPPLWVACNFVLPFDFVIRHIPEKMNTAADFLSGLKADPRDKIVLKVREGKTIKPIEVNIESASNSPYEPVFNIDDDLNEDPDHNILQRTATSSKETSSQPPVLTIAAYYHNELPKEPSKSETWHILINPREY